MMNIHANDTKIVITLRKVQRNKGYHYRKIYNIILGCPDIVFKNRVKKGNNGEIQIRQISRNIARMKQIKDFGLKVEELYDSGVII